MKKIKLFKKGSSSVMLAKSDILGFVVVIKQGRKVIGVYSYDTMHESLNMFWYCVCMESGMDRYIS